MATYLPGVQTFLPQTQVFTPDYKFLQDVLSVRQDRYDTNYKEINKLYGQVVYAPLSRAVNKDKRDQYSNQLTNALKQVSGMDLSLGQNVRTAQALFKPFYEDKDLVTDMYATKTYRKSQKDIDRMKNSNNLDVQRDYWIDGEKWVNYRMQDFVNATDEDARKFNVNDLKYQRNPDIYNTAMEILDEEGFDVQDFQKIDNYIIKLKNGTALTEKPYKYVDENGELKSGTRNVAMEYVVEALKDNPKILNGMRVQQQVARREWVEDNLNQYGGDKLSAGQAWDVDQLSKSKNEDLRKLAELNSNLDADKVKLRNWETYKKEYGIKVGSKLDEQFMKTQYEVALQLKTKKIINDRVVSTSQPTENQKLLQQKAAAGYISNNMESEFYKASVAYASKTASRELIKDPTDLNWAKFNYQKQQDAITNDLKRQELMLKASELGTDISSIIDMNSVRVNDQPAAFADNKFAGMINGVNESLKVGEDAKVNAIFKILKGNAYSQYLGESVKGDETTYKEGYLWINNQYMDQPQARKFLSDPKNYKVLDQVYEDLKKKFQSLNVEGQVNDFAPGLFWDEKGMTEINTLFNTVDANEQGLDGSALAIYQKFGGDIMAAHEYIMKTNPNSEFAKRSEIFLPITQTKYGEVLESIGVPISWLNSGANEKINDPNSKYNGWNTWDAIEDFAYQKDPSWFDVDENNNIVYKDGKSFYDVVNTITDSNTVSVRTRSELYEKTLNNIKGQGIDPIVNYLNQNYPNGKNDAYELDPSFSGRNKLRGEAFVFQNGQWGLNPQIVSNYIQGEGGYYSEAVNQYNTIWDNPESKEGTGMPYLTSSVDLWGTDGSIGMMSVFISEGTIGGGGVTNMETLENFDASIKGANLGHGNSMFLMGNYLNAEWEGDNTEETTAGQQQTKDFFNQVLLTQMRSPEWIKKNGIKLSYTPKSPTTYEDEFGETKHYAAYVYSNIPESILGELSGGEGPDGEKLDQQVLPGSQITILVKEEFDEMFNSKAGMNDRSDLERIVRANKVYSPTPVAGGGHVTYYLDDQNVLTQSIRPVYWDPNENSFVPDTANYIDQLIDISAIDAALSLTTTKLLQIKDNNYASMGTSITHEDKINLMNQQPSQR
jgi:hypothetical protein